MIFNSALYVFFLSIVWVLYWFVTNQNLRLQNLLIAISSYLFYCWWSWRFIPLLFLTTLTNYFLGVKIGNQENNTKRKFLLWGGILINISLLGFFKYYDFFIENFTTATAFIGFNIETNFSTLVLPLGISFYTLQIVGYLIEVYWKKIKPINDFITFSAFVSFFPQLIAGPIQKATLILPQFCNKRTFNYSMAVDGMRQILWGLFKKAVIAGNCANYANLIFDNSTEYSGSTLVLGALLFAFQIYGDFSGYSDIAIGIAKLFGFKLMQNFKFPYFSKDIAEFWRRWHISLSNWLRDYVYIPLGGSRGGTLVRIRNIFIVFIVSGFWHGANWTYIIWGILNALYFLPLLARNNPKKLEMKIPKRPLPTLKELSSILVTFCLTTFAWIFFRAESIEQAIQYISKVFSPSLFTIPQFAEMGGAAVTIAFVGLFILIEWLGRDEQYAISRIGTSWRRPLRWGLYALIIFTIGMFMQSGESPFIYSQF